MNNFVKNNPANFTGTREQFETAMEDFGPYFDGETPAANGEIIYFNGTVPVSWHSGTVGYIGPYTVS